MSISIRIAEPTDVPLLLQLIRELAEYERLTHEMVTTEQQLHESLFGPRPVAEALVADFERQPAGMAVFFHNFSTFLGRPGMYLEDVFVRESFRGNGIGSALLRRVAAIARERDCGRFEWAVLDWNEPAIEFYRRLGAIPMDQWTVFRVTGEALENL